MERKTYASEGVDIEKGDRFARFIGSLASPAVSRDIGGFAGGLELDTAAYRRPVLLSTTDGVGTKLLVAKRMGDYSTIGIDLVAMCVNDLIVCGAAPMVFLDYIACSAIDEARLREIIGGIVRGCEQAGCTLSGGETAEMPDMYAPGDIDLAGFCVGIAEKERMLPRKEEMKEGDVVFGLPSVGVHSNGLSLARHAIAESDEESWRELLQPTKIYVKELSDLIATGMVLGAAHITGGGLAGNLQRVLPPGLTPSFSWDWPEPAIFAKIRKGGNVEEAEMRRVFNLGIGIALVVRKEDGESLSEAAGKSGISVREIGTLVRG